jgi:predicted MFS family arabinose efflux permease
MGLLSMVEGLFAAGLLPFLIDTTGSPAAANAIEAVFWITMSVAELPTGYLQDRWGGRKSLLYAAALRAVAFVLLLVAGHRPVLVVTGMILAGVAVTFLTGTFSMQLRLGAQKLGWPVDYTRFASQMSVARQMGLVSGCLLSYFVIRYLGLAYIWLAATCLSLPLFLYVQRTWDELTGAVPRPPMSHYSLSLKAILALPALRNGMFLDAGLIMLSYAMIYNWVVVYLPDFEHEPGWLVGITVALMLWRSMVSHAWSVLGRWLKAQASPLLLLTGAGMAFAALSDLPASAVGFIVASAGAMLSEICIRQVILENLPPDQAAAVSSVQSLMQNLAGAGAFLVLSFALTRTDLARIWWVAGLMLCLLSLFATRALRE